MKQKLAQARHVFKSKESQLSEMDTKLRSLSRIKTLPQLEEEREKLMDEIRVINEKLRYYEAQEKQAKVRWEYYRSSQYHLKPLTIAAIFTRYKEN